MDAYETTIYTAVLITGVVTGCIIIYFAVSVFRQQRKHIRLQRHYFLDEISLLEKERTRIARDLHDELAPILSVTKFQVSSIRAASETEESKINKVNGNLELVMNRLGQIAVNLTPGMMVHKGLRFALEDFFRDLEEISTLRIAFLYQVQKEPDPQISIHVYRIVQEVVYNSVKHSGASELTVHLKERFDKLYILCKDNGKGFDQDRELEREKGLGLRSVKSRTGMLGGKLRCSSTEGLGTEYFFELPLK
jgi:signal transduction histidine kinase